MLRTRKNHLTRTERSGTMGIALTARMVHRHDHEENPQHTDSAPCGTGVFDSTVSTAATIETPMRGSRSTWSSSKDRIVPKAQGNRGGRSS